MGLRERLGAFLDGLADARQEELQAAWLAGAAAVRATIRAREEEVRIEECRLAVETVLWGQGLDLDWIWERAAVLGRQELYQVLAMVGEGQSREEIEAWLAERAAPLGRAR
ncbi:hypothetical protein L6R53_15845 [Myxococcota bacterium]|nr:hypothetical protein [Myxococcota bacterium]